MRGDLTNKAMIEAWKPGSSSEPSIVNLINQVSHLIYNFTNRNAFLPTTITSMFDGHGERYIMLPEWPVTSIISLKVDDVLIPKAPSATAYGWVLEGDGGDKPGAMQALYIRSGRFSRGVQNIEVKYVAGYQVTNEAQPVVLGKETITPEQNLGIWGSDLGVTFNGVALTKVAASPVANQYSVNVDGNYTFSSSDVGKTALISYGYIPSDLSEVAMEWIAELVSYKERIGQTSKSAAGQETVAYSVKEIPTHVEWVLRSFQRVVSQ